MITPPLISVVIAAYNASRWIAQTLDSVLAQDYQDFEIIVVDDGSTDDTAQVVAAFGDRVHCIHKANGGQPSARNVGIRHARGQYIAFVDADDLWSPNKLGAQVALLKTTGLAWVYSDAYAFDGQSGSILFQFGQKAKQQRGDVLVPLFLHNFIPSPTPVIQRSVFDNVGYFDEHRAKRIGEDWDMWLRIAACYPIALVAMPLAYYRFHTNSMTGGIDPIIALQSYLNIIDDTVKREPLRIGALQRQKTASCYYDAAGHYARKGLWREAKCMYAQTIRTAPSLPKAYAGWFACLGNGCLWRVGFLLRSRLFY